MRLGIIGLPNSGKTTIFNALTGQDLETAAVSSGQFEVHTAVVNVPDARIDKLTAMYNPKKTIYATITFADIAGMDKGISEGGLKGQFRNELQQVDGLVHVIRAFESASVPHPYETVDPQRDLNIIDGEFIISDLISVENRLQKLNDELRIKGKKAEGEVGPQIELMNRLKAALEEETPLRDLDLTADEVKSLRGYGFLSLKPVILVFNAGDGQQVDPALLDYPHKNAYATVLQGKLEAEIAQLDAEGAEMFMAEFGITERSAAKVIRLSYELMRIQSFFTVGEDEVRAWSVAVGATAPEAAGTIHSDLQRGFIRAEVMAYADLIAAGSEAAIKAAGKFRLEGKEYVVKDGDILNIRFSPAK
ncbi:MAG: redox-regulated ATPase YchF [Anaerolineae bacterium]|nr:MAG: putative GTP-binding protein [Chloroflexi bacterium OLB13]MBC6957198.1 redox-regulated ATPase YchF [Chloroflexota bacterium]MBV6438235.1 Ribosome-binding ATPase YchF [Anaerolineae bacterium]MDL1916696.1 redox-regulated ATPase YchF [Anaerolineae bacterium CFX4]OQY83634.1 MAG: redox-regulated ATPase YchF [Anaerolineae bacterium UTCFX5]